MIRSSTSTTLQQLREMESLRRLPLQQLGRRFHHRGLLAEKPNIMAKKKNLLSLINGKRVSIKAMKMSSHFWPKSKEILCSSHRELPPTSGEKLQSLCDRPPLEKSEILGGMPQSQREKT